MSSLFFTWLLLQHQSIKQPFEWLDALKAQAIAGGAGQHDKLMLLLLHTYASSFVPLSLKWIKWCNDLFHELPRIEWKSVDVSFGVRQILEELMAAGEHESWDASICERLNHWVSVHSSSHRNSGFITVDASVLVGQLLYGWMLTMKGQSNHAMLLELCFTTKKSIVEHAQSLAAESSKERDRLLHAAATVFGKEFSSNFVILCENPQWKESGMTRFSVRTQRAWKGQFLGPTPQDEQVISKHRDFPPQLCDMILYLVYIACV
ncbi:uncharacterized protein LOC112348937 isoform X2 [Selaginella moellendorffii]|uniref:uncharacterized protein LOC112348937 isoform X2 n=1 Tax=Selaginella moellendorffii TaxID=88036 RepID=UPI000D1C8441|nr:uncharacterized protein LOC112348937 isoform X2 [Selaginella moellendorffii]|eukprot:XP_024538125.1 uncharacterized protein LOC112348937 isoform X2 [Selaginella moellendorffii]